MDEKKNKPDQDKPGAVDRPGFDIGGSRDRDPGGARNVTPMGPRGGPATGTTETGRAQGLADARRSEQSGGSGNPGSGNGSGPTDGSGGPK